jgi:hypothetical protein
VKILYVVMLTDGTEHRGEYVGAADGYMYLATGDEIVRIEQKQIAVVGMKQVPADE